MSFPRAFAYGLIDNDEKVASSKEHTQVRHPPLPEFAVLLDKQMEVNAFLN